MSFYPVQIVLLEIKLKQYQTCQIMLPKQNQNSLQKSDVPAKKIFITLKAEVGELDINKLTNGLANLNDLKTKEVI